MTFSQHQVQEFDVAPLSEKVLYKISKFDFMGAKRGNFQKNKCSERKICSASILIAISQESQQISKEGETSKNYKRSINQNRVPNNFRKNTWRDP